MRRVYSILGLVVLATISSCNIQEEVVVDGQQPISFYAVMEEATVIDAATRAYVDDQAFGFWNKGDLLSVFYGNTYNKQHKYVGPSGSTSGRFDPVNSDDDLNGGVTIQNGLNFAIYPYDDYNACQEADGMLIVPFPKERTITSFPDGIGASIMLVAKSETKQLPFKHVAGYLGFQLKGENVSVASITLESGDNEPFSGSANVVFGENDELQVSFVDRDHEDSPTCTFYYNPSVELDASTPKTFWITLPPTKLANGLKITVKDASGRVWERKSSKNEIKINTFQRFNPMEVIPVSPVISVTGVTLEPTTLELNVNETATLNATVLPENATDKTVTWSSDNPGVATVDQNGKVTAVAAGDAVISVKTNDGEKTATCAVTVKDIISHSLAITPATATINYNETQTYEVTLTTVKNGVTTTSTVDATLSSDATDVATVSGLVATGKKGGTAKISASYEVDGTTVSTTTPATLTVKDVYEYSLAITPASATINYNETQTYEVTLTTVKNGETTTAPVNATLSSDDTSVATVSGLVATGKKGGTAKISASYEVDGTTVSTTTPATLNVKDVISYSLAISPAENARVAVGKTLAFTLTLTTTTNGTAVESPVTTENWTSSDTAIATISAGTATGVAIGEVIITAKYTPSGSTELTATAPLTVTEDPNHAGDPIPIGGETEL